MIVVVGGGPAGRYAAMRLANAGKEVTLIDKRKEGLGGQCLHQGCMVICALNDIARTIDQIKNYSSLHLLKSSIDISYPTIINRMQDINTYIAGIINSETKEAGVRIISGDAEIEGRSVIINGERIEPEKLIIASGARPNIPHIPGTSLKRVYTAHTILSLPDLPKKMVIIGGGVIASEYAYIFSVFGVEVTMVVRSRLLHKLPEGLVHQAFKDLGKVRILEETEAKGIQGETSVSGVSVRTPEGEYIIEADTVLIAAGMTPETEYISGVQKNPDGSIWVNHQGETSVPGVYAAGDVTGTGYLTPVARRQGRYVADLILGKIPPQMPEAIPQAIKLRNDLAFCNISREGEKTISIPGPAGSGTFWSVPERHTGYSSITIDKEGQICAMAEASPAASISAAYTGWMMNAGITVSDLEPFLEVHPSADGIPWITRFLADKERKEDF